VCQSTEWARRRAMTDEEGHRRLDGRSERAADDATPRGGAPRTETLCRALALTQEEFALRYRIRLGALLLGARSPRAGPAVPRRADRDRSRPGRRETCFCSQALLISYPFSSDSSVAKDFKDWQLSA